MNSFQAPKNFPLPSRGGKSGISKPSRAPQARGESSEVSGSRRSPSPPQELEVSRPKAGWSSSLTNIQTFKGPSAWLPPVFPDVLYPICKCLQNASSSRMEWDVLPSAGYCEFWHKRKRFLSLRNMFYWGKGELLHMGVGRQCIAMMLRREKQRPITYSPLNSCHSFCF